MPLTIRPATENDVLTVVAFNDQLARESEGKTLDPDTLFPGVVSALSDPHKARYFLALEDDSPVGQIMFTTEWSDWRNGWIWWIQSVFVRPDARRRGVFRALFQYLYELARKDPEVIGLRLYVEQENQIAQQTYASLGMRPAGYLVFERYPL